MFKNTKSSFSLVWIGLSLLCLNPSGHAAAQDRWAPFWAEAEQDLAPSHALEHTPLPAHPTAEDGEDPYGFEEAPMAPQVAPQGGAVMPEEILLFQDVTPTGNPCTIKRSLFQNPDPQEDSFLAQLPNELLLKIVTHLSDPLDIFNLAKTCKKFKNAVPLDFDLAIDNSQIPKWAFSINPRYIKSLKLNGAEFTIPMELNPQSESIQSLDELFGMDLLYKTGKGNLIWNSKDINNIRSLTLSRSEMDSVALHHMLTRMPHLSSIFIISFGAISPFTSESLKYTPSLRTLDVHDALFGMDNFFQKVLGNQGISTLRLSNCVLRDSTLTQPNTTLLTLDLSGTDIEKWEFIKNLTQLQTFIRRTSSSRNLGSLLENLKNHPTLSALDFEGTDLTSQKDLVDQVLPTLKLEKKNLRGTGLN